MTHTNIHIPEQHSAVTDAVISALTAATISVAGLLVVLAFAFSI